jgi:hypothetical protein
MEQQTTKEIKMKMYELPAGTCIHIIDKDMLLNVDCRNWHRTYATRDSFYENPEFIDYVSVSNNRDDNFPSILKDDIRHNRNLVILRSYHNGKIYFAKASKYQLNYIG